MGVARVSRSGWGVLPGRWCGACRRVRVGTLQFRVSSGDDGERIERGSSAPAFRVDGYPVSRDEFKIFLKWRSPHSMVAVVSVASSRIVCRARVIARIGSRSGAATC